jgi:predicted nucleic acid-binding protein
VDDVWVVNASPLIALAHAKKLELLEKLSAQLVIPDAVAQEILAGRDDPARRALVSGWGQRRSTAISEKVAEWGLGQGESAVVATALELGGTAVLDDRSARRCAKALGVPIIGTFGVIIRARKFGLIEAAQPVIRSVVNAGLYYDDDSLRKLLSSVGEAWS